MRPTGKLHLGHYHGVLKNWIKLQHEFDCFFFVADWHALTTHYDDTGVIEDSVWEMVIDWIAAGIEPSAASLFLQSKVPEHAELHLLLSMITPLSWLERVPTYKDQQEKLKEKDLSNYGFLGYPLLQSADILIYRAGQVPVGEDQVVHVELTREVARRFNHLYGRESDFEEKAEAAIKKMGKKNAKLYNQKMSKSYGNTIALREPESSLAEKIKKMPTDTNRVRRTDPGNPDLCPVWQLHEIYATEDQKDWVQTGCRTAGIGCLDCKGPLIDAIAAELKPIRERAENLSEHPEEVRRIIEDGNESVREVARDTLNEVRSAMGLSYK
ncbi:UNVERIFIED_CONTAM: hypothetical protein GTU68_020492 [Idotea baltica]|nr:hypothetical protein [Idotea baltica]